MDADILRLAREAGWSFMEAGMDAQRLAHFTALVRADEREACAKAARTAMLGAEWALTERVLRAIRARGHQPPATVADRLARHGIPTPGDNT